MSYGSQTFEHLRPVFESSCCTHYKSDFFDCDRRLLEASAVPGMAYLFHIRPHGTHLIVLGLRDESPAFDAVVAMTDPKRCELYLVKVGESSTSVKEIGVDAARILVGARPDIGIVRLREGPSCAHFEFRRASLVVGAANAKVRYDRDANRTFVDVEATILSTLDRLTQKRVSLLVSDACTRAVGSLWWAFGAFTINGAPCEQWNNEAAPARLAKAA